MSIRKTDQGRWRATLKSGGDYLASRTFDREADAVSWLDGERRLLGVSESSISRTAESGSALRPAVEAVADRTYPTCEGRDLRH